MIDTAPCRTCRAVGVLVGLLIAIELARNLPDVLRYLKLKAM